MLAEGFGIDSAFADETGGSGDGGNRELVGDFGGEAGGDSAFAKGGDELENVGGAAAAEGGDRVELGFGKFEVFAEGAEDSLDEFSVFGGRGGLETVGGDSGADLPGKIWHGADDVAGVGEFAGEDFDAASGEDGEDEFAVAEFGNARIEIGELLGFEGGDDDGGVLEQIIQVGGRGNSGGGGESFGGSVGAAGAGDLAGGKNVSRQKTFDHGAAHAAGSEKSDFHRGSKAVDGRKIEREFFGRGGEGNGFWKAGNSGACQGYGFFGRSVFLYAMRSGGG